MRVFVVVVCVALLALALATAAGAHQLVVVTPSGNAPVVLPLVGDDPAGPSGHAATCGLDHAEDNPSGVAMLSGPECPD
jgi:hypothetical protein